MITICSMYAEVSEYEKDNYYLRDKSDVISDFKGKLAKEFEIRKSVLDYAKDPARVNEELKSIEMNIEISREIKYSKGISMSR